MNCHEGPECNSNRSGRAISKFSGPTSDSGHRVAAMALKLTLIISAIQVFREPEFEWEIQLSVKPQAWGSRRVIRLR